MHRFIDLPLESLERTLDVNLKGVFLCGQAAARHMVQSGRGGVIVNIASMAAKQGRVPYLSDYVASKFGVVGLTQAMAFELARYGIRVNSVCPGYVATPMQERELTWEAELAGSTPEAVKRAYVEDTPLGRLQQPEDVAHAVAWLLSAGSDFITGEAIAVNGGAFMD
jgi:NAD(P)-dependent dehydrogenase (short-subunit alcohol dehydrogenase family)